MSVFLLIHGAAHGGWCWHKVKKILEDGNHSVFAPDLPGHEQNPSLAFSDITFDGYVRCVVDLISRIDKRIVLVGHSLGGAVITRAIDVVGKDRIEAAVYVSGLIPRDGDNVGDLLKADTQSELRSCFKHIPEKMSVELIPDKIADIVYNGCCDADIEYARGRVVPQSVVPIGAPIKITRECTVRRIGIVCTRDKSLTPEFQEKMYRRAGCEIRYLDSGHAPFFSVPFELSEILVSGAANERTKKAPVRK